MNHEIEVRIPNISVKDVVEKLESIGAKKVFEGELISKMFDYKDNWLNRNKRALRLRSMGDTKQLVLKEKLRDGNIRHNIEYELEVSDFDTMEAILKLSGFGIKKVKKKYRISYALDDAHFEIDTMKGFPTYLEIEVHHKDNLNKYLNLLGYSLKDTIFY